MEDHTQIYNERAHLDAQLRCHEPRVQGAQEGRRAKNQTNNMKLNPDKSKSQNHM